MFILNYQQFKESLIISDDLVSVDIMESMNIIENDLVSAISGEELDLFDTLKLPFEEYHDKMDLEFLSTDVYFINSLSSLALKKSVLQNTSDFESFMNIPLRFLFLYDIEANELENPIYILLQFWSDTSKSWIDTKLFKINSEVKRFYDVLSSKTIELIDNNNKNYIYKTSNTNDWELQNLNDEDEIYKRFLTSDELRDLVRDKKLKVNII
jgi:hypothetical protein